METPGQIEKNVALPTRESKYAVLDKLEIGDSVVIAVAKSSCLSRTIALKQEKTGKRFKRQKVEGGVRVWRTKPLDAVEGAEGGN